EFLRGHKDNDEIKLKTRRQGMARIDQRTNRGRLIGFSLGALAGIPAAIFASSLFAGAADPHGLGICLLAGFAFVEWIFTKLFTYLYNAFAHRKYNIDNPGAVLTQEAEEEYPILIGAEVQSQLENIYSLLERFRR